MTICMHMIFQKNYNKVIRSILIGVLAFLFVGCNYIENNKYKRLVKREYGRILDLSWPGYLVLSDTIISNYQLSKPITIVSCIDDRLCTDCFAKYLHVAEQFVNKFQSEEVQYVCITHSKPVEEIQESLVLADLDSTKVMVVYDYNDLYLKRNRIEKVQSGINVFLIDKDHRILLVGDPIRSRTIYELYKTQIETILNTDK